VDFNNTIIRSLSVNKDLNYNGYWTGGVYGFWTQLVGVMHRHKPNAFLVCNDKKPYLREKIFPGFKGDRKKQPSTPDENGFIFYDALHHNLDFSRDLLEQLNIDIWEVEGLEADDLIAYSVQKLYEYFDRFIILSNDTDLNQLLSYEKVVIYKKTKYADKQSNLYTVKEFCEEFKGIVPEQWIDYTAMVGTHNGVPGIKGVGPKTATKFLNHDDLFDDFLTSNKEILDEKRILIELPFPLYKEHIRVPKPVPFKGNYRKIAVMLNNYGITMTNHMREAIEQYT
jgi:5'-3' exonuclease